MANSIWKKVRNFFTKEDKLKEIASLKSCNKNLEERLIAKDNFYSKNCEELKSKIKLYKNILVDSIKDNLKDILVDMSIKELAIICRRIDSGGWELSDTCEELLGKEDIESIFYYEAGIGCFAEADGYKITDWREKYYLGKSVQLEHMGWYEHNTYKVDYNSQKFQEYERKLYIGTINRVIEKDPNQFIKKFPNVLRSGSSIRECLKNKNIAIVVDKHFEYKRKYYGLEHYLKEKEEKSISKTKNKSKEVAR